MPTIKPSARNKITVSPSARNKATGYNVISGNSSDEPTPEDVGSTILKDGRSSIQSYADINTAKVFFDDYTQSWIDEGYLGFTTNVDGSNTKAFRFNFAAGVPNDDVAHAPLVINPSPQTTTTFCFSAKVRFGKSTTDVGGVGTDDIFDFIGTGYTNPHIKMFLWTRQSGVPDYRIYERLQPGGSDDFQIDYNNYNSSETSASPLDFQGQSLKRTYRISPTTIEAWQNGVKIINLTGQDLGGSQEFTGMTFFATLIGMNSTSSAYLWDVVLWEP